MKNQRPLLNAGRALAIVVVAFSICSCGEVALQRKYRVDYTIHLYNSPGANVVIPMWLTLPEIMKKYDTKPNMPLDLSVPLMGKGLPTPDQIPPDTGSMIIIWSAKPLPSAPPVPEEEIK